jgi:hypothetical protein
MSLIIRDKTYHKKHKDSVPLARIEGGPDDKKLIYLIQDEDKGDAEIKLTKGKLVVLPRLDKVEKIYVSGVSGSGKSTWCSSWIKEFLKKDHKHDPVYIFSAVSDDKAFYKFEDNIERIELDSDLLTDPIQPEDLEESIVILDDTDSILNRQINKTVADLRDALLELGRHNNTRMLCTSHILSNYKATRKLLNEATTVVVFPKSGQTFLIRTFLEKYCGLSKQEIKKFMGLKSRYVSISRQYNPYIMYEKGIYMLRDEND